MIRQEREWDPVERAYETISSYQHMRIPEPLSDYHKPTMVFGISSTQVDRSKARVTRHEEMNENIKQKKQKMKGKMTTKSYSYQASG